MTKKSVIAIQNSSGIHVLYLLSRLQSWRTKFHHWKWTTNFKGSILLSLDKFQWNKKSSFSRPIQMFILANSKWTAVQDKSFKWKLKLLCYNNKKNVNLIFGHCCCLSHQIHLVSTVYNKYWNAATSKQN